MQVVETYARSYFQDMDALNVTRPDISPRASAHSPEQLEMMRAVKRRLDPANILGRGTMLP